MPITTTTAITDSQHLVTYVDAGGVTRSAPRNIEVRVFAPDVPGAYPVILYSHGMGGSPFANSAHVASALAALGYIVIAPTHLDSFRTPAAIQNDFYGVVGPAAVHRVADLQFLLSQAATVTAGLAGYGLNLADVTVAGHSLGAFTAQLLTGVTSTLPELAGLATGNPYGLTSLIDQRFKQAILLSPQGVGPNSSGTFGLGEASWETQTVPALTITGTLDSGFDNQSFHDRLDGFAAAPALGQHAIVINGADHAQIGGDLANPQVNAEVTAAMSLFLQAYVQGDEAARDSLTDVLNYRLAHPLVSQAYGRTADDSHGALSATSANGMVLTGLATKDHLVGNLGADTLSGGFGADTLTGGGGNDIMSGGGGNDLFGYSGSGNLGNDVIVDFNVCVDEPGAVMATFQPARFSSAEAKAKAQFDHIDLRGTGYSGESLGNAITLTSSGTSTLIIFSSGALSGTSITLLNVEVSSIASSDFLF
jgi:dienelactone hydrolase